MADLHESHEEQVERTVSSPEAVTEYLNGYCDPIEFGTSELRRETTDISV